MRLGITRSGEQLEQLRELTETARSRGVEIVPLPFTEIEFIDFKLPDFSKIGDCDWFIFSSANGVEALARDLQQKKIELSRSCQIAAVGKKTQQAVESAGWKVDFLSSAPYGRVLFQEFITRFLSTAVRVIYMRAEEVEFDPRVVFESAGMKYYPVNCYRSNIRSVSVSLVSGLGKDDAILFTAPSSVHAYARQFGKPLARAMAIGTTTAAAMERLAWGNIVIMPEPDIERVLELV